MKKKLVSALMCVTLVASLLAGCGKDTAKETTEGTDSKVSTVQAGDIPEAVYYYSFDAADDKDAIQPTAQTIGGDPILSATDKEKKYIPGVKGDSLYVDGVTGYKLTDVNGVGDTYSVSFWVYATRFANYMPSVQFGPDVHGDATGGQHYLNITRAEWSGEGTYPCIWAYDQLDNALWPAWADAQTGEPLKQWLNITLVVDSSKVSVDGTMLEAQLYMNGEEIVTKDSDGNVVPINVVKGCMSKSDNFDFLLGVNYWDSVFKGAFDELYIFDKALTAEEALALYQAGDPTVAYEEPERVITVTKDEKAVESIGKMDFSNAYGESVSSVYKINDGQTVQVKMKNWSDGKNAANNYSFIFSNGETEVAAICADMTGYFDGDKSKKMDDTKFSWSWGNWNTWEQSVMVEADSTVLITRNGDELTLEFDNVDYNKTSNTAKAVINVTADSFVITNAACYTDILGVKDKTVQAGGITVGNTDCTTPWWSQFSDIFEIPEGTSVTKTFTNYTDGVNNWDNFVVILQNTPTGHSADAADGYAEYAVVRADNYGWGTGYDGIVTPECNWNWDTFTSDMDGAKITATITNNGATADIDIIATTTTGAVYNQKYNGISTNGPLFACFSCEAAYLNFDAYTVGNTDCTTPWWNQFSNILKVEKNESRTVYFKNYTDGVNNWDNFVAILQNTPDAHSADADANYKEYAVVRADNFGWGAGFDGIAATECDWNWDSFTADMDGAYVALTVTNNGTTADVKAVVNTADGKQYHQTYTGIAVDGDLYFCLGCEASYLLIEAEKVGFTDCTTPWWNQFSNIWEVKEGQTVSKSLVNHTDGVNNWDNFVVVLQNTATGHSAEAAEGYAEYAVVRADNYGWGAGYDGVVTPECDWEWGTFTTDMDGANVVVDVTNNGATADIVITATTSAGKVYHQTYKNITTGGDLYFCFGCEASYLMIQ